MRAPAGPIIGSILRVPGTRSGGGGRRRAARRRRPGEPGDILAQHANEAGAASRAAPSSRPCPGGTGATARRRGAGSQQAGCARCDSSSPGRHQVRGRAKCASGRRCALRSVALALEEPTARTRRGDWDGARRRHWGSHWDRSRPRAVPAQTPACRAPNGKGRRRSGPSPRRWRTASDRERPVKCRRAHDEPGPRRRLIPSSAQRAAVRAPMPSPRRARLRGAPEAA